MNTITVSRRAALIGAFATTAACLTVPVGASPPNLGAQDMEALIAAHKAAHEELSAAYDAEDAASTAYFAETDAKVVTVELPGLRFLPHDTKHIGGKVRFAAVNARQISEERIRELYQHYDFYSQRGGYRFIAGEMVKIDLSRDQARDEAAALANLNAAFDRLRAVAEATGKTAADNRVGKAFAAVEASWLALLAHSPRSEADAMQKRNYLADRLDIDGLDFGHDQLAALISSLAGQG